jgi:hypothetical protein
MQGWWNLVLKASGESTNVMKSCSYDELH